MIRDVGGYVACVTSTNVRVTENLADPAARIGAQSVRFTPHPSNAAEVYIGLENMDPSTGVGVLAVLAAPISATDGPFAPVEFVQRDSAAGLNVADFWVQGSNNDEVIVSYVQG